MSRWSHRWQTATSGRWGGLFPRELTRTTVPRLWAARQEAISIMEQHNYEMMMAAMPAVLFIITASEWLGQQGIRAGDDVGEVFSIVNQFLDDLGALKLGGG